MTTSNVSLIRKQPKNRMGLWEESSTTSPSSSTNVFWYSHLKKTHAGEECLLDHLDSMDIPYTSVIIVSRDLPTFRPSKTHSNPPQQFAYFRDLSSFYFEHLCTTPLYHRHFHELSNGSRPLKMRFDIDLKMLDFLCFHYGPSAPTIDVHVDGFLASQHISEEDISCLLDLSFQETLNHLVRGIERVLRDRFIDFNPSLHIALCTSHGQKKRSGHLILQGFCFANDAECLHFLDEVLSHFPDDFHRARIDRGIYRPFDCSGPDPPDPKFGNLRFLFCSKITDPTRVLTFCDRWIGPDERIVIFQDSLSRVQSPKTASSALSVIEFTRFLACSVSYIRGCKHLPCRISRFSRPLNHDGGFVIAAAPYGLMSEIQVIVDSVFGRGVFTPTKCFQAKDRFQIYLKHNGKLTYSCRSCGRDHTSNSLSFQIDPVRQTASVKCFLQYKHDFLVSFPESMKSWDTPDAAGPISTLSDFPAVASTASALSCDSAPFRDSSVPAVEIVAPLSRSNGKHNLLERHLSHYFPLSSEPPCCRRSTQNTQVSSPFLAGSCRLSQNHPSRLSSSTHYRTNPSQRTGRRIFHFASRVGFLLRFHPASRSSIGKLEKEL